MESARATTIVRSFKLFITFTCLFAALAPATHGQVLSENPSYLALASRNAVARLAVEEQKVGMNFAAWGGSMKDQNRYPETFLGDPAIDFVMLAKAQGIEGMHVHEPRELEPALRRARDAQAAGGRARARRG